MRLGHASAWADSDLPGAEEEARNVLIRPTV